MLFIQVYFNYSKVTSTIKVCIVSAEELHCAVCQVTGKYLELNCVSF